MGNRPAARRKFTNLAAKENSVHFAKRRGRFGRKGVAENQGEPIRIYLTRYWARVKGLRTSRLVKVQLARRPLAIDSKKPWRPNQDPANTQSAG